MVFLLLLEPGVAPTFGKEATVAILQMLAQEPTVTEFIVSFDQFDLVAPDKAQFIGAAGDKVIWTSSASVNFKLCMNFRHEWPNISQSRERHKAKGRQDCEADCAQCWKESSYLTSCLPLKMKSVQLTDDQEYVAHFRPTRGRRGHRVAGLGGR